MAAAGTARAYYDLDAVLADQQKLPCTFEVDGTNIGFLLNNETASIPAGAKVDLPVWLAEPFLTRSIVTAEMPKMFGERVRAHARADATVINLNDLCQSFFLLGKRLVALLDDDETAKLLVQTFNDRLQVVMDVSQHSGNQDVTSRVNKLDLTELRLFQLGAASAQEFQRWKNRQASRLLPSDAAVGSNPRKRPFGSS